MHKHVPSNAVFVEEEDVLNRSYSKPNCKTSVSITHHDVLHWLHPSFRLCRQTVTLERTSENPRPKSLSGSFHATTQVRVCTYGKGPLRFSHNSGSSQGYCLPRIPLNCAIDWNTRRALGNCGRILRVKGSRISGVEFIDDIVIISEASGTLQSFLNRIVCEMEGVYVIISTSKTKVHDFASLKIRSTSMGDFVIGAPI